MSSIIACSSPLTSGANGTRCGVLPRSLMPSAWASRLAGSMVSTTTVRPYSAARSAIAAAVVVLPTPPAPQQTITRFEVSCRIEAMSRAGGVVLIGVLRSPHTLLGERFSQFVQTAQVDTVGQHRQFEAGDVDLEELFGALGPCRDSGRVLDGLGEQAGEIRVGQRDSCGVQLGLHSVGVAVALSGLREIVG